MAIFFWFTLHITFVLHSTHSSAPNDVYVCLRRLSLARQNSRNVCLSDINAWCFDFDFNFSDILSFDFAVTGWWISSCTCHQCSTLGTIFNAAH